MKHQKLFATKIYSVSINSVHMPAGVQKSTKIIYKSAKSS